MNKKDLETFKNLKQKIFTTSEVIQKSFANVLDRLKEEDYVIVENQRQKKTLIIQEIETVIGSTIRSNIGVKVARTPEQVINLSKMFIKENVFYLMKFESNNITFPEIESIIDKITGTTKAGFDVQITKQLMSAWKYIIFNIKPLDFSEILKIHSIIAKDQALEWGVLRNGKTSVSGTSYSPPIPTQKDINILLSSFKKAKDKYKSGAEILAKLIKSQPFWDGNKRTAFITINKLFIEYGLGVITIKEKDFDKFNLLLHNYYNDENKLKLFVEFVLHNCIYNTPEKKLV